MVHPLEERLPLEVDRRGSWEQVPKFREYLETVPGSTKEVELQMMEDEKSVEEGKAHPAEGRRGVAVADQINAAGDAEDRT